VTEVPTAHHLDAVSTMLALLADVLFARPTWFSRAIRHALPARIRRLLDNLEAVHRMRLIGRRRPPQSGMTSRITSRDDEARSKLAGES